MGRKAVRQTEAKILNKVQKRKTFIDIELVHLACVQSVRFTSYILESCSLFYQVCEAIRTRQQNENILLSMLHKSMIEY